MSTSKRGFASMDPKKQKELASLGGRTAHQKGLAHEWNTETGRAAGIKGRLKSADDKEHMAMMSRISKSKRKMLREGRQIEK